MYRHSIINKQFDELQAYGNEYKCFVIWQIIYFRAISVLPEDVTHETKTQLSQ
jgi:hypothetical protein